MKHERKRDIFAALLFFMLGMLTLFVLIPRGVTVPSSAQKAALSPEFWPRIIAIAAIISSVFLFVENTLLKQPPPTEPEDAELAREYQLGGLHGSAKTAILIIALFCFYFSLTTLGVVAASIILICAMMLFFGERNLWLVAVLSISTPVLLYGFFRYVANVPMPLGIFAN